MNASISKGWDKMGSSNASRNGRGGSPTSGTHARRTFDEDEDSIFALSLDDVMGDRPWTADELMGDGTHSAGDPSETAAFLAAAQRVAPKPPVADLDDFATRQLTFDSWADADPDETSAGAPTLDEPVNPLVAASAFEYEPDSNAEAIPTSSYTDSDDYYGDYYAEEEPSRFSDFNPVAKIIFIAIVVVLLGVIAFEGFQLFRSPVESESATQQKKSESNDYLDVNNLKGDPNDGDE